jgi:hypothetical protein
LKLLALTLATGAARVSNIQLTVVALCWMKMWWRHIFSINIFNSYAAIVC